MTCDRFIPDEHAHGASCGHLREDHDTHRQTARMTAPEACGCGGATGRRPMLDEVMDDG